MAVPFIFVDKTVLLPPALRKPAVGIVYEFPDWDETFRRCSKSRQGFNLIYNYPQVVIVYEFPGWDETFRRCSKSRQGFNLIYNYPQVVIVYEFPGWDEIFRLWPKSRQGFNFIYNNLQVVIVYEFPGCAELPTTPIATPKHVMIILNNWRNISEKLHNRV